MADSATAKPVAADLEEVVQALARQQVRAEFARLNLPHQNTTEKKP